MREMAWAARIYSKGRIDRAGSSLVSLGDALAADEGVIDNVKVCVRG